MGKALRILAVDNQPSVTLSMRYLFDGPNYAVTAVNDGKAALTQLTTDAVPFDVIIVDQKMPNLSGLDLVTEIKKRGVGAKIIVVSAHLSSEIRKAYEGLGVSLMFSKPFDIDGLRAAVGS